MTQTDDLDLDLDDGDSPPPSPSAVPPMATPFSAPMSLGGGLPPLEMAPRPQPYGQGRQPQQQQPRRTSGLLQHHSLESLYASIPELGTDQARLRVERLEPDWVQDPSGGRVAVSGVIATLFELPSMQDFANRFGGRKYRVYAERLSEDRNNGGEPRFVDVAFAEFKFPLDPNLDELPIIREEEEMGGVSPEMMAAMGAMGMSGGNPYGRFSTRGRQGPVFFQGQQGGGKPSDILDAVRTGADFARAGQQSARDDSAAIEFMSGLSREQVQAVKEFSEKQAEMLQRQIEERDRELLEMRREMREASNRPTSQGETLNGVAAIVSSLRGSAGDQEASQLRASHDREIERLNRQFASEKESLRSNYDRDMTAFRAQFDADKRRWEDRERDINRERERQEQGLRDEMERRESAAKRDAEREISNIRQVYDMQMTTLKNQYEERFRMQEMHANVLQKQIESSGTVEIRSLQRDIAMLTAERDRLRQENEDYRQKINKTPIEAIQEAHTLAEMTGMIRTGGDAGKDEEPKSNTDKIIDALANGLETSAPTIFGSLGSIAQGLVNRGAPPKPQQGTVTVQHVQHNAPRFVDSDAAPLGRLPQAQREQQETPPPRRAQAQQQTQQQPTQQTAPQPQTQPQAPQDPSVVWAGFEWTGLAPDQLYGVCSTIETAIVEGKAPEDAKTALVELFGPETVSVVAQIAEVDHIIASVGQAPATKGSHMNSSKGRKFLRQLWALMAEPVPEAAP